MHVQHGSSIGAARSAARSCILALLAGVVLAGPAAAQLDLLGPGAGFVSVGAARISTSELDEWLGARDYPTFGQTAVSVGFGGYRVLSSGLMLGFEAQGFIIGDDEHDGREMGLGGGYATLGAGYALDVSSRLRVYPRIGVGPGGMALWFQNEDSIDFEEVVQEQAPAPARDPNLARDGLVLDLGAGAEFIPAGRHGPMIGVRVGYLTGPFTSNWEMYEHSVSGGPDASIAGPYARVVVGWAWSR